METYNYTIIEKWWRSLGTYDRNNVKGNPYFLPHYEDGPQLFLKKTDNWWDSLTNEEKVEKYNDFFEE